MLRCSCRNFSAASPTPGNSLRVASLGRATPSTSRSARRPPSPPGCAVLLFPGLDVGDLKSVVRVGLQLLDDRDDDEWPDRIGRRQLVDRRIFRRPMGWWVKLGAELVCPQRIFRRLEAVLRRRYRPPLRGKSFDVRAGLGRCEGGVGKAGPDGNVRGDRMGQIDIFRTLQGLLVNRPKILSSAASLLHGIITAQPSAMAANTTTGSGCALPNAMVVTPCTLAGGRR